MTSCIAAIGSDYLQVVEVVIASCCNAAGHAVSLFTSYPRSHVYSQPACQPACLLAHCFLSGSEEIRRKADADHASWRH